MKFTPRIIFTGCAIAALALFSPVAFATDVLSSAPEVGSDHPQLSTQPDQTPGTQSPENASSPQQGGKDDKFKKLVQALGLSSQQKSYLKPIIQRSHMQVMEIRKNTFLSTGQKHAQIQQVRHTAMEQIKGILTPVQRAKLRDFIARAKARGHQNPQQG